jgi:hypothetical protein
MSRVQHRTYGLPPAGLAPAQKAGVIASHQQQQLQQQPPMLIVPGVGVGPFRLGSSIGSVLSLLQSSPSLLRGVASRLISSPSHPASMDLVLELPALGLRLRFDPVWQRMHLIDAFDAARAPLVYMRSPLSARALPGPAPRRSTPSRRSSTGSEEEKDARSDLTPSSDAPSFAQLYILFGPTYLGSFDPSTGLHTLQYPGLALTFALPASSDGQRGVDDVDDGGGSEEEGLLQLPDGSSPPLERLFVHGGAEVREFRSHVPSALGGAADASSAGVGGGGAAESMVVLLGHGGGLWLERRQVLINFASRAQDLLTDIGPPQHLYVKQRHTDKMSIHRASVAAAAASTGGSSTTASTSNSPLIQPRTLNASFVDSAGRPSSSSRAGGSSAAAAVAALAHASPSVAPDYFFNYFLLGMDVLLDGITHRVKKIILHTNFVDRPDFGLYARAHFSIAPRAGSGSGATGAGGHGGSGGASSSLAQSRGVLSLLELPPTAIPSASLSTSSSGSGSSGLGGRSLSGNHIVSAAPEADISLHVPTTAADAEDGGAAASAAGGGGGGGGGKKKKKKGGAAAAPPPPPDLQAQAAAANHATLSALAEAKQQQQQQASRSASGSPLSQVQQQSASRSPSSSSHGPSHSQSALSSSPPGMSFSPSLSPSVLPVSHASVITPLSKWSDVLAVLGPCPSRPMVSTGGALSSSGGGGGGRPSSASSSSSGGGGSAGGGVAAAPFGPTYFYAYEGVVFEVAKSHHLASVTLFDTEQ